MSDVESGFNKTDKPSDGQPPQIVGGMGIPSTTLMGSGRDDQDQDQDEDQNASTPQASELVLEAYEEQQELLDAFAKLSDEMKRLLVGFENSTFVKRLKASSRKQIDIAADLNNLDSFGLADRGTDNRAERKRLANLESAESKKVTTIIQDMSAYADRRPSANYLRVLSEMEDASIANQMRDLVRSINRNFVGLSTIEAEYWGDTLDRWAEQLVDPLPEPPPGGEGGMMVLPNLPPEIVVKVLRIINREIQLREETREVEQAKDALGADKYYERSEALSDSQYDIAEDTHEIAREIALLPNIDEQLIQMQHAKVSQAALVMDEAESILAKPDTGPKAIAAISEVIEILLATQRMPNTPGGGSGGQTPGGGGQGLAAIISALRLMGSGDDSGKAFIENRSPKQAIGKAGRVLPEEFRQGLDAYFNVLEGK